MKENKTLIFQAIKLVAEAHEGQYRKGTQLPYITHLMNVMKILIDHDCDDAIVTAGILHDTIEDTSLELNDIESRFGSRIKELVRGASEVRESGANEKASWKSRKEHTIEFLLKEATTDQLIVSCADKLDNITAIKNDYLQMGNSLWERFNAGKDQQQWYYTSLALAFAQRASEAGTPLTSLSDRFTNTVKEIFE